MKFGYQVIKGKQIVDVMQAKIINQSMQDYINGVSLKTKAEQLTAQEVEYAPGKSLWNKNRVQRMITDTAYLGTENYPAIVRKEVFEKVKSVMDSRNTQKNKNREEVLSSSMVSIRCGKCGCETLRRYEGRTKEHKVYHICNNPECDGRYTINDMDLRKMVRDILAEIDEIVPETSDDSLREIRRLNNEIEKDLQSIEIDELALKNKILECAALKYSQYTNPKESIDYSQMDLCSLDFNHEIKRRIKSVFLESDTKIWLYLSDGRIVGKDVTNNECCD